MLTNADITLYNYVETPQKQEWIGTQIRGVSFYTKQETAAEKTGLVSQDSYQIRIPETADTQGKYFIDPDKYLLLSDGERENYWTIDNGSIFVKGLHGEIRKESDILNLPYAGKVVSFSDNRRGSPPMHHFRIGGKR